MDGSLFSARARRLASRALVAASGCWEWTGAIDPGGYGAVKLDGRKVNAHRAMFEAVRGPAGPRAVIRHTCNNPRCIRPDHLVAGSRRENIEDAKAIGYVPFERKLNADDVRWIPQDKRKAAELAAAYGVTVSTIYRVRGRRQTQEQRRARQPFKYKPGYGPRGRKKRLTPPKYRD